MHLFIKEKYSYDDNYDDIDDDDDDNDDENDEDDDDDEVSTKKTFKFLHIRPPKHALCQLIAVGTTPFGNDFYY